MPAQLVTQRFDAIAYTGSNSAEIDSLISDFTINSESGGSLSFTSGGVNYGISTGDWLIYRLGAVVTVVSNSDIVDGHITPLTAPVAAFGAANVPTLALNQSTTVSVDISPAMPNTSYTPTAKLVGAAAPLSITAVAVNDANTVDVTVQAGLAYVAGAQVVVHATRP